MDVFLDYHGADVIEAQQLARAFEHAGREVLLDDGSIVPERAWLRAVGDAGLRTPFLLLLITPRTPRDWIEAHQNLAMAQHAWADREGRPFTLIPVLWGGRHIEGFPGLEGWPFAEIPASRDLAGPTMSAFGRDLDRWARAQAVDRDAVDHAIQGGPFPGLRAFNEARATLFMGRDEAIRDCLHRVGEGVRWLQIEGASGVGKTSLVRSGLLVALRLADRDPFGDAALGRGWRSCVYRPGDEPVRDLALALHTSLGLDGKRLSPEQLAQMLLGSESGLVRFVDEELPEHDCEGLVLVLDQLDDGFTQQPLYPEAFEHFDKLVARTVLGSSAFRLITTVRADRLDDFRTMPQLQGQLNLPTTARYHLPPMREDELRAAIVDPIHLLGGSIEDPLVERLVQLAEPESAQLPKIAVILRALWRDAVKRDRSHPVLALADLTALEQGPSRPTDRLDDVFVGLRHVFSRVMDQSLEGLSHAELEAARDMLVHVVRPGRSHEDMRCMRPRGEVATVTDNLSTKKARRVLEQLAGPAENRRPTGLEPFRVIERLGTSGDTEGLDLRHDALLTEWRVLSVWLEESREFLERRDELMLLEAHPDPFADGPPPAATITRLVGEDLEDRTRQRYFHFLDAESRNFVEKLERMRPGPRARPRVPRWVPIAAVVVALLAVGGVYFGLRYLQDAADDNRMAAVRLAESEGAPHAARILLSGVRRPEAHPSWSDGVVSALEQPAVRRSLVGPGAAILDLAASADGAVLAAGLADGKVVWWGRDGAKAPIVVAAHQAAIRSVAVAPDGSWLVSTSHDGTARIHPVDGGEPIVLDGHTGPVGMAAVDPRGRRLITASDDGTARVWKPDGTLEGVLDGHRVSVRFVDVSADGSRLLTAGQDGTVRVWELSRGALPAEPIVLPHGGSWIQAARFAPDGETVLSGTVTGELRLWTRSVVEDEETLVQDVVYTPTLLGTHRDAVVSASFDAAGERVVSASKDRTVRVWRVSGGEEATLDLDPVVPVRAIFAPEGPDVLVACETSQIEAGEVRRWTPGEPTARTTFGSGLTEIEDLIVRSSPPQLVTGSSDGVARVWDLEQKLVPETLKPDLPLVSAWFGDVAGNRLVARLAAGGVRVYDRSTGARLDADIEGWIDGRAIEPGGARVATLDDGQIRVWSIDADDPARSVGKGDGPVQGVAYSPDGAVLAALGEDGVLRLYRAESGDAVRSIRLRRELVTSFAFDPQGTRIVTGGSTGRVDVWSILGDFPIKSFEGATGQILAVAMDDEDHVVAGGTDQLVHVWSVADPEVAEHLDGHTGAVRQVAISRTGGSVLTLGDDRTARLWDLERPGSPVGTSQCSAVQAALLEGPRVAVACRNGPAELWNPGGDPMRLPGDGSSVSHVAFSPDGTELLTAIEDGPIAIWPASVGRLREALLADAEPCLTPRERTHFLSETLPVAESRWRGCERACWDRSFPDGLEVETVTCLRARAPRTATSGG